MQFATRKEFEDYTGPLKQFAEIEINYCVLPSRYILVQGSSFKQKPDAIARLQELSQLRNALLHRDYTTVALFEPGDLP